MLKEVDLARQDSLATVDDIARQIAKASPSLADLSPDQLEQVARMVVGQRLAKALDHKATLAGIDYESEKKAFIAQAKSQHTARAYSTALARLDTWAKYLGTHPLALTAAQVDDWTHSMARDGRSPASVRRDVAAASSFYTWLERRHADLHNPIRGTKARPAKAATRPVAVPTKAELGRLLETLKQTAPDLYAAAAVMAYRGLRVGALPSLTLRGEKWTATTKGKQQTGTMPQDARDAIAFATLDSCTPFAGYEAQKIADRFRWIVRGLVNAGKLDAPYSVHDLRHYFAIQEYKATPDMYRLQKLLGHASIAVTESYLKSLYLNT